MTPRQVHETVLLPADGSDGATAALDHAVGAAEAYGAALHVVSVVDRRVVLAADPDEKESIRADLTDEATEAVERLADRAREAGVETTTAIPEGVPHREICAYADRTDADLLVIGTYGRTGRERRLNLGSTTERVVTDADRPLLVVDIGDGSR